MKTTTELKATFAAYTKELNVTWVDYNEAESIYIEKARSFPLGVSFTMTEMRSSQTNIENRAIGQAQ